MSTRQRTRDSRGAFAPSELTRESLREEQNRLIELATATDENVPGPGMA